MRPIKTGLYWQGRVHAQRMQVMHDGDAESPVCGSCKTQTVPEECADRAYLQVPSASCSRCSTGGMMLPSRNHCCTGSLLCTAMPTTSAARQRRAAWGLPNRAMRVWRPPMLCRSASTSRFHECPLLPAVQEGLHSV